MRRPQLLTSGEAAHLLFCVMLGMVALAMLIADLSAQTIRIANHSDLPSSGWTRTTVDTLPPVRMGKVDGAEFVVGRQVGRDVWAIDVRCELKPGEQRTIALDKATPADLAVPGLPNDVFAHFGGIPTIAGVPLQLAALSLDGTAWTARLRARVPPLLNVDVWIQWRGDEPAIVRGEAIATASNPAVPDVVTEAGGALRFAWGDALVHVVGAGWDGAIVPAGTTFATGQARAVAFTALWTRHLQKPRDWLIGLAAVNGTTCAVGIERLLVDGNPTLPAGFNAKQWTVDRYSEALRRLHTWEVPVCGPNKASGDTGAQEDQVFVRGEPLLEGGVGAEQVAYLSALKLAARPCHHLNVDGSIVDPTTAMPRLIFWDGMPHWSVGVSPNRLGKPRNPTPTETNGWVGPDVEHWLYNTVVAATRYTGSHALQWELRCQAMLYLGQWTTTPGWSTTQPYAARAVGWEGIMAVHVWHNLEDRALAERVRAWWLKRATEVILPAWQGKDFVDIRVSDPRLGPGEWWIPWQQSVGAYGLDLACSVLGPAEGRAVAMRVALAVLRDAWEQRGDVWLSRAQQSVAQPWGEPDGSFNAFGMPLAVAVVLRQDPTNERAKRIWGQLRNGNQTSWLPPLTVAQ